MTAAKVCSKCRVFKPASAFAPTKGMCKMCWADYMREYRASHPTAYQRERDAITARARAMERLADRHPEEFADLCTEERAMVGLPPVGSVPLGRPRSSRERRRAS